MCVVNNSLVCVYSTVREYQDIDMNLIVLAALHQWDLKLKQNDEEVRRSAVQHCVLGCSHKWITLDISTDLHIQFDASLNDSHLINANVVQSTSQNLSWELKFLLFYGYLLEYKIVLNTHYRLNYACKIKDLQSLQEHHHCRRPRRRAQINVSPQSVPVIDVISSLSMR